MRNTSARAVIRGDPIRHGLRPHEPLDAERGARGPSPEEAAHDDDRQQPVQHAQQAVLPVPLGTRDVPAEEYRIVATRAWFSTSQASNVSSPPR